MTPSPDPKVIWQTVLATAYQEYTAAKNSDRSHRDGVVVTPVEIVDFQVRALKDSLAAQGATLADPRNAAASVNAAITMCENTAAVTTL